MKKIKSFFLCGVMLLCAAGCAPASDSATDLPTDIQSVGDTVTKAPDVLDVKPTESAGDTAIPQIIDIPISTEEPAPTKLQNLSAGTVKEWYLPRFDGDCIPVPGEPDSWLTEEKAPLKDGGEIHFTYYDGEYHGTTVCFSDRTNTTELGERFSDYAEVYLGRKLSEYEKDDMAEVIFAMSCGSSEIVTLNSLKDYINAAMYLQNGLVCFRMF